MQKTVTYACSSDNDIHQWQCMWEESFVENCQF